MPITSTATTNASNLIGQIWDTEYEDAREANLILTNLVNRQHGDKLRGTGADRVLIHGVDSFQAETVAQTGNSLAAGGTLTFDAGAFLARISLIADQHAYQAFDLEYELELFTNVDLMAKLAQKSAYAVSHRIDDDCAALFDDFSQAVGTLAVGFLDADVRRAIQYLDDAFAPSEERSFAMSPAARLDWIASERVSNSLYATLGKIQPAVDKGYMGDYLGLGSYASQNMEGTNAAGHDNAVFHRSAIAAAIVEEDRAVKHYEIGTDSIRFAVHAIYGFIELRDNHGVFVRGL